jgi:hypothetical protein
LRRAFRRNPERRENRQSGQDEQQRPKNELVDQSEAVRGVR